MWLACNNCCAPAELMVSGGIVSFNPVGSSNTNVYPDNWNQQKDSVWDTYQKQCHNPSAWLGGGIFPSFKRCSGVTDSLMADVNLFGGSTSPPTVMREWTIEADGISQSGSTVVDSRIVAFMHEVAYLAIYWPFDGGTSPIDRGLSAVSVSVYPISNNLDGTFLPVEGLYEYNLDSNLFTGDRSCGEASYDGPGSCVLECGYIPVTDPIGLLGPSALAAAMAGATVLGSFNGIYNPGQMQVYSVDVSPVGKAPNDGQQYAFFLCLHVDGWCLGANPLPDPPLVTLGRGSGADRHRTLMPVCVCAVGSLVK